MSLDGGKTWTRQDNQPTAQFYHVITDTRTPYNVYGAQQDNSTIAIASRSDLGTIGRESWYAVGGGEAGYIAPILPTPISFTQGTTRETLHVSTSAQGRSRTSPCGQIFRTPGARRALIIVSSGRRRS